MAVTTGPGSVGRRNEILGGVLVRATAAEADFVRRLLVGELRQGALEGVMVDAIARASEVPATVVRRAHMLGGRLGPTARLALFEGRDALEAVGLEVGRGRAADARRHRRRAWRRRWPSSAPARWSGSSTGPASRCTAAATT